MKHLYNEDCLKTLERDIEYHYVVASPPDFNEITGDSKTNFSYTDFLKSFAEVNFIKLEGLLEYLNVSNVISFLSVSQPNIVNNKESFIYWQTISRLMVCLAYA